MKDWLNDELSPCTLNECYIMTNREFLKYAFFSGIMYVVKFKLDDGIAPDTFCSLQQLQI